MTYTRLSGFVFLLPIILLFMHSLVFFIEPSYYILILLCLPILWCLLDYLKFRDINCSIFNLIFPLVSYLYLCTPIVALYFGVNVYSFEYDSVLILSKILSFISGILFFSLFVFVRRSYVAFFFDNIYYSLNENETTVLGRNLFSIFGLLFAVIYVYFFLSSGMLDKLGTSSRLELANAMESGKVWLIQYIMSAWVMAYIYIFRSSSVSIYRKLFNLFIVFLFLIPFLLVGSRREITSVVFFFLIITSVFGGVKKWIPIILVSFSLLVVLGVSRSLSGVENIDFQFKFVSALGEFLLPHMSLFYFIDSKSEFILGASFYQFPLTLLPSAELWDKPITLAREFAIEYAGGEIGYAFTPYSEAFLNFGYIGLFLFPIVFSCFFSIALRVRQLSLVMILIVSFSFDINRGEFSSILTQLCIYYFVIVFLKRLSNFK